METTENLVVGQYVKSKAGRDKDRIFIILAIIDENYLQVADGDLRKADKPKRKKIKHLAVMHVVSDTIHQFADEGKCITDRMLKQEIEKLGLEKPL